MQVWCAAGVNLSGGKTKDGGNIVGGSVFYSQPQTETSEPSLAKDSQQEPHIHQIEQELKVGKNENI